MNWVAIRFDWNQVRAFLATAETGSLSAAARALGLTQPTLSRQVSGLEEDLGVTLFQRGHRAMQLTHAGLELLEHVQAMGEAAMRVSLTASGQSRSVVGKVSITTTELFASYHLPAMLQRIREAAPGIELELITANEVRDLRRREADIAVRHARPQDGDLIARRIGCTTAHLYASRDYLQRLGPIQHPSDLGRAEFIGFEEPERLIPQLQALGVPVSRQQFKIYTASGSLILALMAQGLGIGMMTRDVAERWPTLEPVLPELPAIEVPIWLVTHRELHTSRRIRLVFDVLAEGIAVASDEESGIWRSI